MERRSLVPSFVRKKSVMGRKVEGKKVAYTIRRDGNNRILNIIELLDSS